MMVRQVTKRGLHRRIAAAQAEISAALFFAVPNARKETSTRQLRYTLDGAIRALIFVSNILDHGPYHEFCCEGCSKPLLAGQPYAYDGEHWFHAKCAGVKPEKCSTWPTVRESRKDLHKRIVEAREHLARRGRDVSLPVKRRRA
ncbi:MAG TPA: hypothetical protein VIM56_06320 [Rhizomicrobium sp.]